MIVRIGDRPMIFQALVAVLNFCLAVSYTFDQSYFINPEGGSLTGQQYVYQYQPGYVAKQYPNDIDKVIFHRDPGLTSQYSNLVFNYVKDFAGTEPSYVSAEKPVVLNTQSQFLQQQANVDAFNEKPEDFSVTNSFKAEGQSNSGVGPFQGSFTGVVASNPDYFLPSDALSVPNQPLNALNRKFQVFKFRTAKPEERPTNFPPIGGSISDYILLRNHPNHLNFPKSSQVSPLFRTSNDFQQIRRQSPDDDDSVIIDAEAIENMKNSEEPAEHKEAAGEVSDQNEEESEKPQPGIAQSKPSAVALAGIGGVAHASPVATALVGEGGLAVSAPSGTAVAGTKTQEVPGSPSATDKKKTDKEEDVDSD